MAWPKGKKRGTKRRPLPKPRPEPKQRPKVAPLASKSMAFYQERIKGLEYQGHGLYVGICPACGKKELRVFDEVPVEVRCAKCRFWCYGADQFEEFKIKMEVDNALETGEKGEEAQNTEVDDALQQREEERAEETQEVTETSGSAEAEATGSPDNRSPETEEALG